jgi:transposase-like protein
MTCGHPVLHRHGRVRKAVRDTQVTQVWVQRYRCPACGHTQRVYPAGASEAQQSDRLKGLAVVLWGLGLSCSATSHILGLLQAPVAKMTVWRDVQAAGRTLRARLGPGRVRVLGADETFVRLRGRETAVGVVVDATTGQTVGVDLLVQGRETAAFERWLLPYVGTLGVAVLVSDDLATYKPVADRLDLAHQVCLAHVRKNVTQHLKEIRGWEAEKEKLRTLVRELPRDGGEQLVALEGVVWAEPKLKALVVRVAQNWPRLVLHTQRADVPATDNVTERAIGRTKVRYRTMRGLKSREGCLNAFAVTQWLYTPQAEHHLSALLAA